MLHFEIHSYGKNYIQLAQRCMASLLDLILFLWRMSTVLEMKHPSIIVQLLPLVKFLKIQSVYNPTILLEPPAQLLDVLKDLSDW